MKGIEQIKEEFCDHFCRIPGEAADEEELMELCKYCPLDKLEVIIND